MSAPTIEIPVQGRRRAWRPPLVPVLCGFVVASSWLAACLVIVLPS